MIDRHIAKLEPCSLGLGLRLGLSGGGRGQVNYDFTGAALPFGFALTRASTGSFVNSSAAIASAAVDVARFDYSPTSVGTLRGLLIEEQRTNLLLRSAEIDNASWTKSGLLAFGSGSVANDIAAPDGTVSADKITENSSAANHGVTQSITYATTAPHTFSLYAKAGTNTKIEICLDTAEAGATASFDLSAGTVSFTGTGATASIAAAGGGWYRVAVTFTVASGAKTARARMSNGSEFFYTGDGASYLHLWGAQIEAGSTASTYVATTGAQATRSAEVCSFSTPPRVFSLRYTFDDDTTQTVSVTPGAYIVPTTLNRPRIKRVVSV